MGKRQRGWRQRREKGVVGCDGGVMLCSISYREKSSVQKGKLYLNSRTREMV